jgi:protein TonB
VLRELAKTHAWSLAIHGTVGLGLLGIPVARHVMSASEPVELEIIEVAAPVAAAPIPPAPIPAPSPPVPTESRPPRVPENARVARVERARPYQPSGPPSGSREAPADAESVPLATTPLPELAMETTVGAGSGDYVSTSETGGSLPLPGGRGGGRGGTGSGQGTPGPLVAHQGARDVQVSPDWEVTRQPEPLNDRDFEPIYPPEARRQKREALVLLRLFIDAAGQVADVVVLEAPRGLGFEKAATDYARRLRFAPAQAGSRRVASRIEWTVHFYVRN